MSRDLMLGTSPRSWERDDEPMPARPSQGAKVALGAMALGTGLSLLGIIAGWWRTPPAPTTKLIPIVRDTHPTVYFSLSPEGGVMMNTAQRIGRY